MKKDRFPASLRVIGKSAVDWWDGWLDMVLVIVVWFFAQLTIVLGPPATFGVYYVAHNMINGEALGIRGLIEGARKYLGQSLLWGLVNLAAIATLVVNFIFYGGMNAIWAFYIQILVVMIGVLWLLTQFYALPYFFEQDIKSLKIAMRNGLFTTLAAPFFSLMLLIVILLVAGLSIVLVIPTFLGLPGLIPMLGFRAVYNRLEAFGLRKPEKTPKEIEFEEGSRISVQNMPNDPQDDSASSPPTGQLSDEEDQIKQQE